MLSDLKPVRISGIKIEEIGKEAVLYSSNQKSIHVLNPTARLIWELCDGQHTPEDIEKEIRRRFAVSEGFDVMGDIRRTLAVFADKEILEQNA
jgi:hypothetical protein